ncbi:MAG: conjugal transfer protein TraE, partial [Anaerolineaceae bacterium]
MQRKRSAEPTRPKAALRKRKTRPEKRFPKTAQKTIPYKLMYPDGICQVNEHFFSKVIQYQDINYQLALEEDKRAIFDKYCEFLNYFDSSVKLQLCFYNYSGRTEDYQSLIAIDDQQDAFNDIRHEYAEMLSSQLAKGNNGLLKSKYIVFGIEALSYKKAKTRLDRIEMDVFAQLHGLGAIAQSLNGVERLRVMHDLLNESQDKFHFNWKQLKDSGLGTKDFIAPNGFDFRDRGSFQMGNRYAQVSYLQILAPELSDELLKNFLVLESDLAVTLHIQSIEQTEAIKLIKRKISDLDKMKIEEQKKAVRSGYDMDILPSDLVTYGAEAKTLLESLQSRNERLFLVTFLLMNLSSSKSKLENDFYQIAGIAQSANCNLRPLNFQQESGLAAMLPLGVNHVPIERALTTSATAVFVPFTTQELFQPPPALYYGLNALSNNLLMADRRKLKTPNGLIIGTPGSGKSFAAKREITNAFLVTEDDIIITDPESEYAPLVNALHGEVVKISINSNQYINPLDLNLDYSEEEDPVALKMDFIFSFIELAAGRKSGLKPEEKSVLDRCI